jgi:hypothetical protein
VVFHLAGQTDDKQLIEGVVAGDSVKLRGMAVIPFKLGVSVGVGGSVRVHGLGGVR